MKKLIGLIASVSILLITSCSETVSNNVETSRKTETSQVPPDYTSKCKFDFAVSRMADQLRNPTYIMIEEAKMLYLDVKADPDCLGKAQKFGSALRAVWQGSVQDQANNVWTVCITNCGYEGLSGRDTAPCQSQCEAQRGENINTTSQTISDFFR